jgi:RimJ/RimL family protein N-acetyltransferase
MIIETERLRIRKWDVQNDLDDAFAIYGDKGTMRFIPGGVKDREQVRASLERMVEGDARDGFGIWPVVHKTDGRVIGACGIFYIPEHAPDVEIAWVFSKDYRRRGYATEAARAVAKLALTKYRLPVLYAIIHEDNAPSIRVAERLGMKPSGKIHAYGLELGLYEMRGTSAP